CFTLSRCFLMFRLPSSSTLFPYTTLFRSIPMYTSVLEEWTECKGKLELLHPGVNWNSPQQIAVLLYDTLSFSELKDHKGVVVRTDRKSTRLNSSHVKISYAVFCLKKKKNI